MNNIDKQYQTLLQTILDFGVEKRDRTGTGTKSIFGYTIRHKMSEGFPLLTTKKMPWKSIVTELLWFLQGNTNIKYLVDNGCYIWNGDAIKNYEKHNGEIDWGPFVTKEEAFIEMIETNDEFAKEWGELGPIYGRQWRSWECEVVDYSGMKYEREPIDQMLLPPCHYGFQVYTRELSNKERYKIWFKNNFEQGMEYNESSIPDYDNSYYEPTPTRAISLMWNQRSVDTFLGLPFNIASYGLLLEIIAKTVNMVPDELIGNLGDTHLYLNHLEQAKEQIGKTLTFEERYAMYTGSDKTWEEDGGNAFGKINGLDMMDDANIPTHTRKPFPLPKLVHTKTNDYYKSLSESMTLIGHLDPKDFKIENYQSHPSIKAPLSN